MNIKSFRSDGMRTAMLALCTLVVGTTPMWAQDAATAPPPQQTDAPSPPHERHNREQMEERQIERLTKHLSLTTEQVTQVRAVYKDANSQMESLHEDTSTPRDQKIEKMKAIHEASEAKVRAFLTDEQKPKFDEMVAHQRGHGDHEDHPEAPPAPASVPPA